ncbi:hypothetical protein D3C71_1781380 [compost metagenome]
MNRRVDRPGQRVALCLDERWGEFLQRFGDMPEHSKMFLKVPVRQGLAVRHPVFKKRRPLTALRKPDAKIGERQRHIPVGNRRGRD